MKIFIDESKLTDGSLVYAVRLTREEMPRNALSFDAVSKADAEKLANKFLFAINHHTNEIAVDG